MGAAANRHTVLLRSDGTAAVCGSNFAGQCNIPALNGGLTYTPVFSKCLVLQMVFDGTLMRVTNLSGNEVCQLAATSTDRLTDIHVRLMSKMRSNFLNLKVVLPNGELLRQVLAQEPSAVLSDRIWRPRRSRRRSRRWSRNKS